jgi:ABC-2 type transport system permease protein
MSRTNYLSTILTLAGKDWRLFWADRRAAVLCFLVPIALASAFGMIFHRPTADSTASNVCLPVLIVVEDDGPFTAQVAVDLLNSTRLETKTATRSDALAAVTNHRPGIAIVLPQGFERLKNWQPGQTDRPTIQILHNPSTGAERQLAHGARKAWWTTERK